MTKSQGVDKLFNEIVANPPPKKRGIHIQEAFRTPNGLTREGPVHDTSQLRCQNTKQKTTLEAARETNPHRSRNMK